jgi:iron complex transport system ATP-binding protein
LTAFLSAQAVSYRWRKLPLLDEISIEIESGQMTIVLGPNGAGKSTLLRLLSGELRPTSGAICCEGRRLDLMPPWLLACKRSVMTQSTQVSFDFTAHEVVQLGMDGVGNAAKNRRAGVVEQCLAEADALQFASRRYDALSGGEQRRVQFARALAQIEVSRSVGGRQALLLDEPVANLDLKHQLALLDAARTTAERGVAVIAILHDLNLAMRYGDSVALMNKGSLVAFGQPSTILSAALVSDVFSIDLSVTDTLGPNNTVIVPSRWKRAAPEPNERL